MNIGMFTETYYPEINGVANSVYMLKSELEQLGHTVYVFTTTSPKASAAEERVFRISSMPCVLITERRVGLFYDRKLASLIRSLQLDIIHTHTEFSLGIFGRIMARKLKIPLVHTYHTIYEDYTHYITHNLAFTDKAKKIARMISKNTCNKSDRIIAPTDKVKQLLLTYQVHKQISVIPTGVRLAKFDPRFCKKEDIELLRDQLGLKKDDRVLLFVGRLSLEKNVAELIESLTDYMKLRHQLKFVIVGGGPDFDRLQQMVLERNLQQNIIFAGSQPWDSIGLYYHLADVFISASKSETQGLTYMEAMAAGLPVVAKEDPCLDQILVSGWNGYAFTDRDSFIRSLDSVLYSNDGIAYRSNASTIAAQHSAEQFARNIEKVYAETCLSHQPLPVQPRVQPRLYNWRRISYRSAQQHNSLENGNKRSIKIKWSKQLEQAQMIGQYIWKYVRR